LPVQIAKAALLVTLVGYGLYVASLIPRTQQSEQYRRHYIARTSDCFFTEAYRIAFLRKPLSPKTIDLAAIDSRLFCMYFPDGWQRIADGRAVSIGSRSLVTIRPPRYSHKVVIDLATEGSASTAALEVTIRQGKRLLFQAWMAPRERQTVTVAPTPSHAPNGLVELTIDNRHSAGERNPARIRLIISRLSFE
jgi:hypothetical protein